MPSARRDRLLTLACGAVLVALLALFYYEVVIVRIAVARLAIPFAVAGATALGAIGAGRLLRVLLEQRIFPEWSAGTPRLRHDFLVGYPLFGTFAFLVSLLSTGRVVQTILLLAGIVAGAFALADYRLGRPPGARQGGVAAAVAGILAAAALFIAFLHAQAPAFTLDEVAYHLEIPRQWVLEGRAIDLPLLSHSYFPLAIESADVPALALLGADGAIASHFLHLFAALAVFAILARDLPRPGGMICAVGIATAPALFLTAGWSWNEWPLVGVALVALVAARSVVEQDGEGAGPAILALALGAGFLVKYTFAAVALALIAALTVARAWDRTLGARVGLVAAIVAMPFLIRNLVLRGNPLAPFFEPDAPAVGGYRAADTTLETIRGYLFSPRFIDEALGPALIALALAAILLVLRFDRFGRAAVAALAIVTAAVAATAPSARILLPFLVPLAFLGATALFGRTSGRTRGALAALLVAATVMQLHLAWFFTERIPLGRLLAGLTTEEELVASQRRDFEDIQRIDAMLPPDSRTLVIGTSELFWFSHPVRGGGNFDGPRIASLLRTSELRQRLADEEITHLAVFRRGIVGPSATLDPKGEERATRLDEGAAAELENLIAGARAIGSTENATLYALP
ncbi:MAG: hypothetical protein ACRD2J_03935 [Thermoanaerobaculia bacterium]